MAESFRIDLDFGAIDDLADSDEVEGLVFDAAEQVAERARQLAPKDSGAGAASIHAEVDHEGGEAVAKVGWDSSHEYMKYQETGTEKMPPHPFLRPALDSTRI